MSFASDTQLIRSLLRRDPSFRAVSVSRREAALRELQVAGTGADKDRYIIAAMRLMALSGNGHTRVIPNAALRIHPLRFVALNDAVYLTDGSMPSRMRDARLTAVNGREVDDLMRAAAPWLAGTPQRRQVIGPILLTWPEALNALGAPGQDGRTAYSLTGVDGDPLDLVLDQQDRVSAIELFPVAEHGGLIPCRALPAVGCRLLDSGVWHLILRDFAAETLDADLAQAVTIILTRPDCALVVDVRGNPGGDFLKTLPLIEALAHQWRGRSCAILMNKFTFSAAIVFVALLRHHLTGAVRLVGEEMGDGSQFFAEGGTELLPFCGAAVRFSTAYHDWETGKADATTPPEIAEHLVAAGSLDPDHRVEITARDLRSGTDPQLDRALALANSAT